MISFVCHHKEPIISKKIQVGLALSQITLVVIGVLFFLKVGQAPRFVGLNCFGGAALLFMADAIARCRSKEIPLSEKIIDGMKVKKIDGKYYLKVYYCNTKLTTGVKAEKFEIKYQVRDVDKQTLVTQTNVFNFIHDKKKNDPEFDQNSVAIVTYDSGMAIFWDIAFKTDYAFDCRLDLEPIFEKYLNRQVKYKTLPTIKTSR